MQDGCDDEEEECKVSKGSKASKQVKYVDDEEAILDETDTLIEPVSYEENQELLRAFGGQAP